MKKPSSILLLALTVILATGATSTRSATQLEPCYRTCAGASCQTAGAGPPPIYTLNTYRRQFLPLAARNR